MKFRVQIGYKDGSGEPWWENYDTDKMFKGIKKGNYNDFEYDIPDRLKLFLYDFSPERWGRLIVKEFNETLRPLEKARIFIKAETIEKNNE